MPPAPPGGRFTGQGAGHLMGTVQGICGDDFSRQVKPSGQSGRRFQIAFSRGRLARRNALAQPAIAGRDDQARRTDVPPSAKMPASPRAATALSKPAMTTAAPSPAAFGSARLAVQRCSRGDQRHARQLVRYVRRLPVFPLLRGILKPAIAAPTTDKTAVLQSQSGRA